MRVLSLFSGIGGFDIGLERAGMQTVAFCEFDPYCQAVLKRHWPEVPIYDDVRTLSADTLRRDGVWPIDVIAGGFPCQDLSFAGKRAGIEGERSGLWSEFARLIGEVRPRFAIMENVPGLLSAGHGRVLGDLAALGYDAVWDCVPASAVGAPHRRDRVWIVAHAQSERCGETRRHQSDKPAPWIAGSSQDVPHAKRRGRSRSRLHEDASDPDTRSLGQTVELINGRGPRQRRTEPGLGGVVDGDPHWVDPSAWLEEPEGVPRVATGIENRAARLKALGNSIVPQVAFLIGQAVMETTK